MKKVQGLPGYKIFEYQIVLNPHEELRNKIQHIRQEFQEKYSIGSGHGGRPQVLLASFRQYEMIEERIVNRLKLIGMGWHPVKIELKGYGSFPSHTIFINVISKLPVQGLVKTIRTDVQRLMKLDEENKPFFNIEPHLTIANKLLPWQYEKGWLEFSHRHFTGRFIADSMLLLKRPLGEKRYEVLARFEFQNLPVSVKQGGLFD